MKVYVYPYMMASEASKKLAAELGIKRRKATVHNIKPPFKLINWGNSTQPDGVSDSCFINPPSKTKVASNKRLFFKAVGGKVSVPDWTTDKEVAWKWLESGKDVIGRQKLTGHSGSGILYLEADKVNKDMFDMSHDIHVCKLFTKYIPKVDEYRIHVKKTPQGYDIFDVQKKGTSKSHEGLVFNYKVRTHNNGFIYMREFGHHVPPTVLSEAVKAVEELGLDFGAADVIYNKYRDQGYVLEINTAPGLEGTTLTKYAGMLKGMIE